MASVDRVRMAYTGAAGPTIGGGVGAGTEIRADSRLAAHSAGLVLDASLRLSARVRALMPSLTASPLAYGDLARGLTEAHINAADELENTVERITAGLQADADKLYALAFAFSLAEQRAAGTTGGMGGT